MASPLASHAIAARGKSRCDNTTGRDMNMKMNTTIDVAMEEGVRCTQMGFLQTRQPPRYR